MIERRSAMKPYVKPKGFEDFTVIKASNPRRPDLLRLYDIENKIIWINTAAAPDANIIALEPKR